jgi:hypothetical protein
MSDDPTINDLIKLMRDDTEGHGDGDLVPVDAGRLCALIDAYEVALKDADWIRGTSALTKQTDDMRILTLESQVTALARQLEMSRMVSKAARDVAGRIADTQRKALGLAAGLLGTTVERLIEATATAPGLETGRQPRTVPLTRRIPLPRTPADVTRATAFARLDPEGTAQGKTVLTAPVVEGGCLEGTMSAGPVSTHVDTETGVRTPLADDPEGPVRERH